MEELLALPAIISSIQVHQTGDREDTSDPGPSERPRADDRSGCGCNSGELQPVEHHDGQKISERRRFRERVCTQLLSDKAATPQVPVIH